MAKTCKIFFNKSASRWEAVVEGRVLGSSKNMITGAEYLRRSIESGYSKKASGLGITRCEMPDGISVESVIDVENPVMASAPEFSINERFSIMEDYIDMVANCKLASTVVTGEGGLGKSFTVLGALKKAGLQNIADMDIGARFDGARGYLVVKGFSTAKGLFRTLYENRKQIIVFDDCDSILRDPVPVNILKAALDSYDKRIVSWNAEGWGGDEDLPKSFEFEGGVIFISNMAKHKIPQAIRSRAMCADVSMTREEVLQRMEVIISSDSFMPEFDELHKIEALEFIAGNADNPLVNELNLRSLVNVIKARASKPDSWKRIALYSMCNS
jgi:hypothetical protein